MTNHQFIRSVQGAVQRENKLNLLFYYYYFIFSRFYFSMANKRISFRQEQEKKRMTGRGGDDIINEEDQKRRSLYNSLWINQDMLGIFSSIWRRWPYPPLKIRKKRRLHFSLLLLLLSQPRIVPMLCGEQEDGEGQASPYCLEHSLCVYVTSLWLLIPPVEEKVSRRPQQQQQQKRSNKSISAISPPSFFIFLLFVVKSKKFLQ